jgi:hypothetical protein
MATGMIEYAARREGCDERRRRIRRIEAAFVEPYRRERPRDAEEARLLRERGTPEHLIGPSREQA